MTQFTSPQYSIAFSKPAPQKNLKHSLPKPDLTDIILVCNKPEWHISKIDIFHKKQSPIHDLSIKIPEIRLFSALIFS